MNYTSRSCLSHCVSTVSSPTARSTLIKRTIDQCMTRLNSQSTYTLAVVIVNFLMPPLSGEHYVFGSCVRPSIRCRPVRQRLFRVTWHLCTQWTDCNETTDIQRVIVHCWKCFQGNRSKINVIARPNALFRQRVNHQFMAVRPLYVRWRNTHRLYGVDAADLFRSWF